VLKNYLYTIIAGGGLNREHSGTANIVRPPGRLKSGKGRHFAYNLWLAFDRTLGKTTDDLVLQDQVDDHDGQGSDKRTGGKNAPVLGILP